MQSASEYLRQLSTRARKHRHAWWLTSEQTGTEESRRTKMLATLAFYGQEHLAEKLESRIDQAPSVAALSSDLRGVVDQTAHDLQDYLQPEEHEAFKRTLFGLLPLSAVDAFCLDRTRWGEQLDGYLVIMNEGLFVCVQLLAKAMLLENLDGDMAEYKQSGKGFHRAAIEHFLAPSAAHAGRVHFEDVPPEIEGALAAAQMRMVILLLQFVLLHELGHIVHRDFELMGAYRFHIGEAEDSTPASTEAYWAAEYSADRFALERILARVRSGAGRWANFVAIHTFFHWLDGVERVAGQPLCPLHPPPSARAGALRALMVDREPLDAHAAPLVEKAFAILESWSDRE